MGRNPPSSITIFMRIMCYVTDISAKDALWTGRVSTCRNVFCIQSLQRQHIKHLTCPTLLVTRKVRGLHPCTTLLARRISNPLHYYSANLPFCSTLTDLHRYHQCHRGSVEGIEPSYSLRVRYIIRKDGID